MPSQSENEVKRLVLNITRYFLPILFISYLASITFFTHVHVVNGVTIVHSPPFKQGTAHQHSTVELLHIHILSHLIADSATVVFALPPFRFFSIVFAARTLAAYTFSCSLSWSDSTACSACYLSFRHLNDGTMSHLRQGIIYMYIQVLNENK